ncbi:unnamed protein product [Meloidogyne enterolobii]|uniref:Uncharacterized protein n=1 Tax=Meloidogyne enterolobii TaxID=390850 RepID=A0ACB0YLV3_MELEN
MFFKKSPKGGDILFNEGYKYYENKKNSNWRCEYNKIRIVKCNGTLKITEEETALQIDHTCNKKIRLLHWIQEKIPGRRVENFSSTWTDGITLGALVDACTSSFAEWVKWESSNTLENTQKAMQAAKRLLGVEKFLTPEELSNPAVNEKIVMSYLSQFPKSQPSPTLDISGIDRQHIVGIPSNPVEIERIEEKIENGGNKVQEEENEINLYSKDSNKPSSPVNQQHPKEISKSPLSTNKYQSVKVWGRGLLSVGTFANEELHVYVNNCADEVIVSVKKDELSVHVFRQASGQRSSASIQSCSSSVHRLQSFAFTPRTCGNYEVSVTACNTHLGSSPYKIQVGLKTISKIQAVGPGLEGGVTGERAVFYVDTRGRANCLEFSIDGPSKTNINWYDNGEGNIMAEYTPHLPGRYTINITEIETNLNIIDSPFVLWIEPANLLPFKNIVRPIHIPAFESNWGEVGKQFYFKIPKEIEAETVYVKIYDPNLQKVDFDWNKNKSGDNSYNFMPQKEGKYLISIVADKLAVEDWPFVIFVDGPDDDEEILEEKSEDEQLLYSPENSKNEKQLISNVGTIALPPPEIQLDIFKCFNFNQLLTTQQTNIYFKNFITKYKNELARRKFAYLSLSGTDFCDKLFEPGPELYDFELSEELEEKWKCGIEESIPLFLYDNGTKHYAEVDVDGDERYKLPTIPKNIEEMKIARHLLEHIFDRYFILIIMIYATVNPQMIQLLFDENETNMPLQIHSSSVSIHINERTHNLLFDFLSMHIITMQMNFFPKINFTEQNIDSLCKFFMTAGGSVRRSVCYHYPYAELYNLIIQQIQTSKDISKMIKKIKLDYILGDIEIPDNAKYVERRIGRSRDSLSVFGTTKYQLSNKYNQYASVYMFLRSVVFKRLN